MENGRAPSAFCSIQGFSRPTAPRDASFGPDDDGIGESSPMLRRSEPDRSPGRDDRDLETSRGRGRVETGEGRILRLKKEADE